MKKILTIIMSLGFIFLLAGCTDKKENNEKEVIKEVNTYEGYIYTKESNDVTLEGYEEKQISELPFVKGDTDEIAALNITLNDLYTTDKISMMKDKMSYDYYIVMEDLAVIKVTEQPICECGAMPSDYVYVANLKTGEVLTNDEIVNLTGTTYDVAFEVYKNIVTKENGTYDEEDYAPGLKPVLLLEQFKDLSFSISKNGKLEVLITITGVISSTNEYITIQN